jgi:hypothetical protein
MDNIEFQRRCFVKISSTALWILSLSIGLSACGAAEEGMFQQIYDSASFQQCAGCHAPGASGFVEGTEATQDWSTQDTAYSSLQGQASGLIGNFEGCNGVPFLAATPADSLLVAVFDEGVRSAFSLTNYPDCTADSISDMTLKIGGALTTAELSLLKEWITAGAPAE